MIGRFQRRLAAWVGRYRQREIERLYAELVQRKAAVLQSNGGRPIRLSPDQHRRLNELRQKIDPEVLRKYRPARRRRIASVGNRSHQLHAIYTSARFFDHTRKWHSI